MLQLPSKDTDTSPRDTIDPAFARVRDRAAKFEAFYETCSALDDAEIAATEIHGRPPSTLISWRGYTIGHDEIELRRDNLKNENWPDLSHEEIDAEYLDAKRREAAAHEASELWYKTSGVSKALNKMHRARREKDLSQQRLASTKPTTAAGAAAMLRHLMEDDLTTEILWHKQALETIMSALDNMQDRR